MGKEHRERLAALQHSDGADNKALDRPVDEYLKGVMAKTEARQAGARQRAEIEGTLDFEPFKVEGTTTGHFENPAGIEQMRETGKATLRELIGNVLTLYKDTLLPAEMSDVLQYHQDYLADIEADRLDRKEPR